MSSGWTSSYYNAIGGFRNGEVTDLPLDALRKTNTVESIKNSGRDVQIKIVLVSSNIASSNNSFLIFSPNYLSRH